MTDLLDQKALMNEKRGVALKVFAILSWIWMGITGLLTLLTIIKGPLSSEDLEYEKVAFLAKVTPETIQVFGEDFVTESMQMLDVTQELFFSINGLALANIVLGFYAVFLMYNLKRNGYYLYLIYSIVPIISSILFFGTGTLVMLGVAWHVVIGLLFIILYGTQLKRMA